MPLFKIVVEKVHITQQEIVVAAKDIKIAIELSHLNNDWIGNDKDLIQEFVTRKIISGSVISDVSQLPPRIHHNLNMYPYGDDSTTIGELLIENKEKEPIIGTHIRKINLRPRAEASLIANGIVTIEQLATMTRSQLIKFPSVGDGTVSQILNYLEDHGLDSVVIR